MGRLVTSDKWCHDGGARKTTGFGGEDNMFIFRNIDFDVLGEHPGQTVPKAVGNVEFKFS